METCSKSILSPGCRNPLDSFGARVSVEEGSGDRGMVRTYARVADEPVLVKVAQFAVDCLLFGTKNKKCG